MSSKWCYQTLCRLSCLLLCVTQDSGTMARTLSWKTGPGYGHDRTVERWNVNGWQKTSQTSQHYLGIEKPSSPQCSKLRQTGDGSDWTCSWFACFFLFTVPLYILTSTALPHLASRHQHSFLWKRVLTSNPMALELPSIKAMVLHISFAVVQTISSP